MIYSTEDITEIKNHVIKIYKEVLKLNTYERHFTMDGHLLGSVGEVFASYHYGITLNTASSKMYDGFVEDKNVQVKITQSDNIQIKGVPDYLVVLFIKYFEDTIEIYEVYNGPGKFVIDEKKKENSNKERQISICKLRDANMNDEKGDFLEDIHPIKKWSPEIRNS